MIAADNGRREESPDSSGAGSVNVAAECGNCQRRFKLRGWREGLKCPQCDGGELSPLYAEGGAIDYCITDRSKGYAQPDIRFAQWAKWAELITPRQYEIAFRKQQSLIQQNNPPQPIHRIMVDEGWMTEEQAVNLLEFMCRKRPGQDDRAFADAVIRSGLAGEDEVARAAELQKKIAEKANETPALCQVMLEKHIISESQAVPLLKKLQENGQGPLATVAEALAGPAAGPGLRGGLKETIAGNRQAVKQVALIIALFLVALAIWRWRTHERAYAFPAICAECGETSMVKWQTDFPVRCPECGQRAAYWKYVCTEGHEFPGDPFNPPRECPICGTEDIRALKPEDMR